MVLTSFLRRRLEDYINIGSMTGFYIDLIFSYFTKKQKSRRLFILSASGGGNSAGLCYSFYHYRKTIRQKLGIHIFMRNSNDFITKLDDIKNTNAELILVSPPLRNDEGQIYPKAEIKDFVDKIDAAKLSKIIFFAPSDDPISPYFELLDKVKLFLTQFRFADEENYFREVKGANIFAEFISDFYKLDPIKENEFDYGMFGSIPDKKHLHKLAFIWSFSFWRRLITLQEKYKHSPITSERPIDVNCRFKEYSGWCRKHRLEVKRSIDALSDQYTCIATPHKIPESEYFEELKKSKILVSPFGWGAVCPKDFEAMIFECLLIKPSMDHLEMEPNVFIPFETYVPVKWDLSDLNEKIEYYLQHPEERQRIIQNAKKQYLKLNNVNTFEHILGNMISSFDQA